MSDAGPAPVRTAVVQSAPSTESVKGAPVTVGGETNESSLFATYEADQKKPYSADYFEISEIWDKEPSLARDLKEIEGYIREQVSNKKVDNSTKAAKEFLKEMERKAGLSRYESTPQRIQKILAYVDFKRVVES